MKNADQTANHSSWLLADLLARAEVKTVSALPKNDVIVTALCDDSRLVSPGSCFVAIKGHGVDGHAYIDRAIQAGAGSVIVDREVTVDSNVAVVQVADSRHALAKLAPTFWDVRHDSDATPKLIGITGTNGKTTVSWLVRSLLMEAGFQPALFGTIEYDLAGERSAAALTTPGPIDLSQNLAKARHRGAPYAVLEVSSHALDQRRCDGLRFAVGVFTNLSGDHLDYHGDMKSYTKAKARLFDLLAAGGMAVINMDDPVGRSLAASVKGKLLTFGVSSDNADISATVESADRFGTRIALGGRFDGHAVGSHLIGEHNVSNVLAAIAAGHALGLGIETIVAGLERVQSIPGRLQRVESSACPFSVLVDYAHTDAALANALATVAPITKGRLICVFGCGGDRDRTKRPRMAAAVGEHADVAIVTSDNPRTEDPQSIVDEILTGFDRKTSCQVQSQVDRRVAIESAIAQATPGDTILIAGKGHETYQLIGDEVLDFDDVAVARECMCHCGIMEVVV